MKLWYMSVCYPSTLLRGLARQHLAWLRWCLWREFWISFEFLCSSNHWSNWWVCFLLPAATSCLKHGETWWAVRWVWSLESCLSIYAMYTCLTKHVLWRRIRPSLTSTQMILLLISMERSMHGRVSEFPHLFSVFLLGFLVISRCWSVVTRNISLRLNNALVYSRSRLDRAGMFKSFRNCFWNSVTCLNRSCLILKAWPFYLLWMNVDWEQRWQKSIPTSHLKKVRKQMFLKI